MLYILENLAVNANECQHDPVGHNPSSCGEQGLLAKKLALK
jgi:hypothetical protein